MTRDRRGTARSRRRGFQSMTRLDNERVWCWTGRTSQGALTCSSSRVRPPETNRLSCRRRHQNPPRTAAPCPPTFPSLRSSVLLRMLFWPPILKILPFLPTALCLPSNCQAVGGRCALLAARQQRALINHSPPRSNGSVSEWMGGSRVRHGRQSKRAWHLGFSTVIGGCGLLCSAETRSSIRAIS